MGCVHFFEGAQASSVAFKGRPQGTRTPILGSESLFRHIPDQRITKDGGYGSTVRDQLTRVVQIQANECLHAINGNLNFLISPKGIKQGMDDISSDCCSPPRHAFAAIRHDGTVVTWGDEQFGGDSSQVQEQLNRVQQIQASSGAFAAIRDGGSVVTWGYATLGGDSSRVQEQLTRVTHIQANAGAFAAIRDDGSVVSWGDPDYVCDISQVQDQLQQVKQIRASREGGFAAIRRDGTVVTWGDRDYGGDSSRVQAQLARVQQIQATLHAFAALLEDGKVVTWGDRLQGGDSSEAGKYQERAPQSRVGPFFGDPPKEKHVLGFSLWFP